MASFWRFLRRVRILALGVAPLCLLAGCAAGPLGDDCRYGCDVYAKAAGLPSPLSQPAPAT